MKLTMTSDYRIKKIYLDFENGFYQNIDLAETSRSAMATFSNLLTRDEMNHVRDLCERAVCRRYKLPHPGPDEVVLASQVPWYESLVCRLWTLGK